MSLPVGLLMEVSGSSLHLDEAPHSLCDQNESVCTATDCSKGRNSSQTLHVLDGGPDLSIDFLQLTLYMLRPTIKVADICTLVFAYRAVNLTWFTLDPYKACQLLQAVLPEDYYTCGCFV